MGKCAKVCGGGVDTDTTEVLKEGWRRTALHHKMTKTDGKIDR
jgi:hypothetical protein